MLYAIYVGNKRDPEGRVMRLITETADDVAMLDLVEPNAIEFRGVTAILTHDDRLPPRQIYDDPRPGGHSRRLEFGKRLLPASLVHTSLRQVQAIRLFNDQVEIDLDEASFGDQPALKSPATTHREHARGARTEESFLEQLRAVNAYAKKHAIELAVIAGEIVAYARKRIG